MIRQPTPPEVAYRWYRQALDSTAFYEPIEAHSTPECGWFKRRLVKHGPFVPARIWLKVELDDDTGELIGDEVMLCEVDGQRRDAAEEWQWLCAHPISEAEFKYLSAAVAWSREHAPSEPMATPRQPVDWSRVPNPF